MSKDRPWLKMWTDWLGDIKMDRLSLAEQGAWWRLISLCHECQHKDGTGKLDGALADSGSPLSLAEIMKSLKIFEELDKAIFAQMLEKMVNAGSLQWDSNTLYVLHYEERQRALTDTKEDRRRRQRELRDFKKREAEKNPSPPQEEELELELEAEEETQAQDCHVKSVTQAQRRKSGNVNSVTLTKELSRCYEKYIGLLNPMDADRMREFLEYYESHQGKIDWVEQAFKNAPVNKRRWPYVQAILERFIEEGGPDGRAGQRDRANRGDTTPSSGESAWPGWDVIRPDAPEPTEGRGTT